MQAQGGTHHYKTGIIIIISFSSQMWVQAGRSCYSRVPYVKPLMFPHVKVCCRKYIWRTIINTTHMYDQYALVCFVGVNVE